MPLPRLGMTFPCLILCLSFCTANSLATASEPESTEETVAPKARESLNKMAAFMDAQKRFSFSVEETIDEVLEETGQKIQLTNRRSVVIERPDKVFSKTQGDTGQTEFRFNGELAVIYDPTQEIYVPIEFTGTTHKMLDHLHEKFQIQVPLADLMFPQPDQILLEHVNKGFYLGLHQVDGIDCHHIACSQNVVDWQLWIDAGEKPWPRKFVITYKTEPSSPQYVAVLRDWKRNPDIKQAQFQFTPPEGAKKVEAFQPQSDQE